MRGRAGEFGVWWVLGVGVWLASLSAWSAPEMVVAVVVSGACAGAAVGARLVLGGRWRPPAALLWAALILPATIVTDTVRVLSLAFRPGPQHLQGQRRRDHCSLRCRRPPMMLRGEFRVVALGVAGSDATAAGRRVVATLLLSATPGSYVVDVDPEAGAAMIHAVLPPSPVERAVSR